MPRFAANLSMLYNEHAFIDRFAAAAADGFKGVEYLFPYAFAASDIAQRLQDHGLQQVLFNAPPGDWDAGERGLACLPGREAEFRAGFAKALEYAQALNCPRIHVMAGLAPAGAERAALQATYEANLAWAAGHCAPNKPPSLGSRRSTLAILASPVKAKRKFSVALHQGCASE